jgi:hypothetical protein
LFGKRDAKIVKIVLNSGDQMKIKSVLLGLAVALSMSGASAFIPSTANASVYRLTATSAASGVLGYLDFDSSSFDGTSFQFVDNSQVLDLKFVDPISSAVVTAIGPAGSGTVIDSTSIPTVVGGYGFTGGTDFSNGVWIYGTSGVYVTNDNFGDVTWSTSGVPEASTWAMMLIGFGGLGYAGYRRNKAVTLAA